MVLHACWDDQEASIFTHTCIRIHTHIHTYIHTRCMHVHKAKFVSTCTHAQTHWARIQAEKHSFIHTNASAWICAHIHTYKNAELRIPNVRKMYACVPTRPRMHVRAGSIWPESGLVQVHVSLSTHIRTWSHTQHMHVQIYQGCMHRCPPHRLTQKMAGFKVTYLYVYIYTYIITHTETLCTIGRFMYR